jgi:hypothetical protein
MPESRAIYGASASVAVFPEPVRPVLHIIECSESNEAGPVLVSFVAALVHPDFVCNLADVAKLADAERRAALELFEFCLAEAMSVELQGQLQRWLQPYLVRGAWHARPGSAS